MNSSLPGSTDNLYPISEAARILGIHPSTLRLWESQGLISPDRTPGGDRRYRLGDLQDLLSRKSDGRLKENGGGVAPEERSYTISEAAQFLGVHPSTLRLWEEQRLVTPARTAGGDRRFSFRQLEDILRRQSDGRRKAEEIKVAEPAPRSYEKIKVRQLEHYQLPSRTRLAATRVFILGLAILVSWFVWNSVPDLTRERVKRAFVPDIDNPIVDVNDALEYIVENDRVAWLKSKFPFLTDFLKVSQDALFNTARFLGTVFFGNGDDYFISPTGDASFAGITADEISVSSINVENLTVTGTTTGVTGTGGGGGLATGGDADTLKGQPGSYYLDLGNEIGTCANCLTTAEIDESTLSISAANADTLDLLDSSQFLRSDVGDTGTGNYIFEDDVTLGLSSADTLVINAAIGSDLIPDTNVEYDLGSAGIRWGVGYFDEVVVNTLSAGASDISGTISSDFSINTDNASADIQDATITFIRGTETPNAVLRWDSTNDRYRFESFPLYLDSDLLVAGGTIDLSNSAKAVSLANAANALNFDSDTLVIDAFSNFVGIGTATPNTALDVNGNINVQAGNNYEIGGWAIIGSDGLGDNNYLFSAQDSLSVRNWQDTADLLVIENGGGGTVGGGLTLSRGGTFP